MPTKTMTKTGSVTETQLAVATAVLFAAAGTAFLFAPPTSQPSVISNIPEGTIITAIPPEGCYASDFRFSTSTCGVPTYRQAQVRCYDGSQTTVSSSTCQTTQILKTFADNFCAGKCRGAKCGVNSWGIITTSACAPEYRWAEFTCRRGQLDGQVQRVNQCTANNNAFAIAANGTCQRTCLPDIAFLPPTPPSYNSTSGTVFFAIGNIENVAARFLQGQTMNQIEALDTQGGVIGQPIISTAGDDGSGGITWGPRSMNQAIVPYIPPTGASRLRITLDPNNLIAETNESNNTTIIDLPPSQRPDLTFSPTSVPTYVSGTLMYSPGNSSTVPVTFLRGQLTAWVEALSANWAPLVQPLLFTAGDDGSGGITWGPNSFRQASVFFPAPSGTARIRVTLDPNNLVTESNEMNNTLDINLPIGGGTTSTATTGTSR